MIKYICDFCGKEIDKKYQENMYLIHQKPFIVFPFEVWCDKGYRSAEMQICNKCTKHYIKTTIICCKESAMKDMRK